MYVISGCKLTHRAFIMSAGNHFNEALRAEALRAEALTHITHDARRLDGSKFLRLFLSLSL